MGPVYGISTSVVPRGYFGFQVTVAIEGIFLGLKFAFPGFFGVGNFGKYFWGWPDLRRNVLEVFKTIERFVVLPAYPSLIVL